MKNNNRCSRFQLFIASIFMLSLATSANAALVSRLSGQAVYDTDRNITWLADANLAATNTFGLATDANIGADGAMLWGGASSWIEAMNTANYLGFNDWRLPISDTCLEYNCTNSEMGHLFYNELGGIADNSILSIHNDNLSLFRNIQNVNFYWANPEYPGPYGAWFFVFSRGIQGVGNDGGSSFAWAVRTGDVAAVPAPAAFWLFGSGLIGLFGLAGNKTNKKA